MIYIYSKQASAHGIAVIINNLKCALDSKRINCEIINTLNINIHGDDLVISYGIKEAIEVIEAGLPAKVTILADAVSAGSLNKIKFYFQHRHFLHYDFFYCIYEYLKYSYYEKRACKKYEKLILVSKKDIQYLCEISGEPISKFICVANGVDIRDSIKPKSQSSKLRLGLLASWGAPQTFQESSWFVKEYFTKFHRSHPNVILKLIGRGSYIHKLKGIPGVEVIGPVESLNDAFAGIDVFIGANPKGCGVLNRCLDAMSLKTPILALPACFSGIPESDSLYFTFTDYNSFCRQINYIKEHHEETQRKVIDAYNYVLRNNNWQNNYNQLLLELKEYLH